MNYHQAIQYLKGLTKFGMNLGLDRIRELLRRLGNPHRHLKIIHIGGTNGKGSTTAMISSILRAAGFKTGMFTSPHLHSYTERFIINGQPVAPSQLAELISEIRPHLDDMVKEGFEHPTEFEVSTALALLYFARQQVDYVALEVGLGGAIDSTNVVIPQVSVITNVALDHMDLLGQTVEEIARVKAGIIKKGVPVVTAATGTALEVIRQVAAANQSRLVTVGREVSWHTGQSPGQGGCRQLVINGQYHNYHIKLPLLGRHQQINAATAVAAVETLFSGCRRLPAAVVEEGLRRVEWPGRLEVVGQNPTVLLDGAHNHAGAQALRQALQEYFANRQVIFVLGMLADKQRQQVVDELAPLAKAVIVTRPGHPRAGDWYRLAEYVKKYLPNVEIVEEVPQAVNRALAKAGAADVVCITGSLYMVADARSALLKK
ncbi:bifunctional folylpolyglutamate synthase/dihydrofolate synthase [Desulforamulus hydrothermalis]|uniref:tetrahydrofolate synthase n=1 Tax=Desulforamulus hydrothermalis Lam5 = DSM 18033 TaxID=1121428 RepID=K8DY23_9FIRM|nr:folylpolyglutamate synthase/dihydrofolate synthase family protein [Desulforamulus hydrothermalis]CCO07672.1 FolC bifunctional protein [Desulforamulus hydrothermalis Lam5 = DSM 18033]SHH25041.1 dihydrofolate synthase / folylpolyglutamate synthase [Desulforamulus hydrothermalis Lam5 = DSM 18033]